MASHLICIRWINKKIAYFVFLINIFCCFVLHMKKPFSWTWRIQFMGISNSRSLNFHNKFHTNECYQFWENFVLYLERACGEFMQKEGNWGIMEKMQIWLLPVLLSEKMFWKNIMDKHFGYTSWFINILRIRQNVCKFYCFAYDTMSYFESFRLCCLSSLLEKIILSHPSLPPP